VFIFVDCGKNILAKIKRPNVCQNVKVGPLKILGISIFHNHIAGHANRNIKIDTTTNAIIDAATIVSTFFIFLLFGLLFYVIIFYMIYLFPFTPVDTPNEDLLAK
jgi:hypothetical protein